MANSNPTVKTWAQVEQALKRMSLLKSNIAYIDKQNKDLKGELSTVKAAVTEFVLQHKDDLGDQRRRSMETGEVSLRSTTTVVIPDPDKTLEYVMRKGLEACFKQEATLIKDSFKGLDPDDRTAAGVSVVNDDTVTIKPVPVSASLSITRS